MKIFVPKEITKKIFEAVKKAGKYEIKGALFAKFISSNNYEIEDVYISKEKGTTFFSNLIINYSYKRFEKKYFRFHEYDFVNHNYIGDWHSHPCFECFPSSYDINEAYDELNNSNANFIVQMIVKIENGKLMGNCYLYNRNEEKELCELMIEDD